MTPMGGWHDALGETMIVSGLAGMLITFLAALRRGQRQH
jgi:hypothetical protein